MVTNKNIKQNNATYLCIIDVGRQDIPHPVGLPHVLAVNKERQLVRLFVIHPPKILSVRNIIIARIDFPEHGAEPRAARDVLARPHADGRAVGQGIGRLQD